MSRVRSLQIMARLRVRYVLKASSDEADQASHHLMQLAKAVRQVDTHLSLAQKDVQCVLQARGVGRMQLSAPLVLKGTTQTFAAAMTLVCACNAHEALGEEGG